MNTTAQKPGDAIHQMDGALGYANTAYAMVHNWLVKLNRRQLSEEERAEVRKHEPDIIWLISSWAKAKGMEHCIDTMTPEQKEIELRTKLFQDKTYDDLVREELSFEAGIEVIDEDELDRPIFCAALNKQLQQAIAHWKGLVEMGYDDPGELYDSPEEFCDRRDQLEYAAAGIEIFRLGNHLQDLPYYDEYVRQLKELDTLFRKVLDGQTVYRPYADRLFWWRQK